MYNAEVCRSQDPPILLHIKYILFYLVLYLLTGQLELVLISRLPAVLPFPLFLM